MLTTLVAEFKFSNFVIDAMTGHPQRAEMSRQLALVPLCKPLTLAAVTAFLAPFGLTYNGTTYQGYSF